MGLYFHKDHEMYVFSSKIHIIGLDIKWGMRSSNKDFLAIPTVKKKEDKLLCISSRY